MLIQFFSVGNAKNVVKPQCVVLIGVSIEGLVSVVVIGSLLNEVFLVCVVLLPTLESVPKTLSILLLVCVSAGFSRFCMLTSD